MRNTSRTCTCRVGQSVTSLAASPTGNGASVRACGVQKGAIVLRCLVVDDDHDGARSLGDYLGILGADVRVAFSGDEAIEIAPEFRPQLVVLDINMPGLNGFETAERLKRQAWAHAATFVAHTAASQTLRRVATAAGFHHFLVKGNSVADFEVIVESLLVGDARQLS
jgi:CheY-like chemotaxis protein